MNISELVVQSGLAAVICIVVAWLARNFLVQLVTNAVRFDFDARLEAVRADLRARDADIAALRGGALSELSAIRAAVARRRTEAADELWKAVNEWYGLVGLVLAMESFDFEASSTDIQKNPDLQRVFKIVLQDAPEKFGRLSNLGQSARPYVSDICWALFSAYRAIFTVAYSKVHLLANGIDGRKIFTPQGVDKVLLAALPEHRDTIEQGSRAHQKLTDVLHTRILEELRKTIEGKAQDADSVQRAAEVMKLAEDLRRKEREGEAKVQLPAR